MTSTQTSTTQDLTARLPPNSQTASSQRLRKREYDRKAQRIAREKTKKRIAQLESLVEKLSHQDDNATTAALMVQLSKVTEQRNKLAKCLRTTSSLFNDHVREAENWDLGNPTGGASLHLRPVTADIASHNTSSLGSSATPTTPSMPAEESLTEPGPHKQNHNFVDSSMYEGSFDIGQLLGDVVFEPDFPASTISMSIEGSQASSTTNIASTQKHSNNVAEAQREPLKCHCSSTMRVRRLSDGSQVSCNNWKAGNEILKEPFVFPSDVLGVENETSEDIPIHVVLHGWDNLAHSGRITPLWRKVRQLDELCFSACGQIERLAVLFIIHLLMRAYADSSVVKSALVPQWYLKSPLQEISHDPSADYFAWCPLFDTVSLFRHTDTATTYSGICSRSIFASYGHMLFAIVSFGTFT
ncbi:bZIP transcription factor [Colletotrichum incanum]|nr:bZIP transcription factor [Colletotrichum incanum]